MEGNLREVIGNSLIFKSPPPPPYLLAYISFDETYLKHFSMSDQI